MENSIAWMIELNIKPGAKDGFEALMHEMVAATHANEPGAINYEWFLNEAGTVCHIFERYADSDALLVHFGNFGQHFAERFMAAVDITAFRVYGNPTDQARQALDTVGAVYYGTWGGFAR